MHNIGIPMDLPTPLDPPPCWNRPPRVTGSWQYTYRLALSSDKPLRFKAIYRWQWSAFEDRCATHDGQGIGPNGESYPEAHGWMPWCRLCRWFETSSAVRS